GLLNIFFTFRNAFEVVTYADNLRHSAKQSRKRLDHRWRKLHGPLLASDVSCVWVAQKPSSVCVYPNVETVILDGLDYLFRYPGRQKPLVDNRRKIGLNQHSAIKCGQRLGQS